MLFRFALGTASSDVDEAKELHEPPCGASERTGDALRRIVSSISCFAQLKFHSIKKCFYLSVLIMLIITLYCLLQVR